MTDSAQATQGRTQTTVDIFKNVGKGLLGGATVYVLSKTSRPGTWIAVAGVAAPAIFAWDFHKNDEKLCYHGGGTSFLRGVQIGTAIYALANSHWVIDGALLGALANIDALALGVILGEWGLIYGLR